MCSTYSALMSLNYPVSLHFQLGLMCCGSFSSDCLMETWFSKHGTTVFYKGEAGGGPRLSRLILLFGLVVPSR